jgi:hypothetical protein
MPKVGMKNFSYDQTGYQKAMQEAQRTGLFTAKATEKLGCPRRGSKN